VFARGFRGGLLKAHSRTRANFPQDLHKKSDKSQDEGSNVEAENQFRTINDMVTSFLGLVEIPVFGVAVLALLIFGERDFGAPRSSIRPSL
jgi:hypothetical protein